MTGIYTKIESVGSDFAANPVNSLLDKVTDILPPDTKFMAQFPDPITAIALFFALNGFLLMVVLTAIFTAASLLQRFVKPGFPQTNIPGLPALPSGLGAPAIPAVPSTGGLANFPAGPGSEFPLQVPPPQQQIPNRPRPTPNQLAGAVRMQAELARKKEQMSKPLDDGYPARYRRFAR